MSTTTPTFNTDAIGEWTDAASFEVTGERIAQYAAATNDPIEAHVAGELAPPVFAVVPAFQIAVQAAAKVIPAEFLMMIVHGEQDFHYRAPIVPGTTVSTRAAVVGVQPRSSGVTVVAKADTHDGEGNLLVEQYMTSFVRGAQTGEAVGEQAPEHAFEADGDPEVEVSQTFDRDQTYRYAEASGDPMPIHLDDAVAKSVGLPGIIIHGLCTMAFTSVALIEHACPGDPTRLKRLAVRFAKPVQPGQTITTRIYPGYRFQTESDDGSVVIKDGLAEVE